MINSNWREYRFIKILRGYPIIKDVRRLRNFARTQNWKIRYLLPGRFWIDKVDIVITTRCNLMCPGCCRLMPYYHETHDANKDELITAMRKLNESFDRCGNYNILGGEPFLNPDLKYFLKEVPSERCNNVQLITNATIIPDDPELYEVMRQKCVHVLISPYPSNEESQKRLIKKLEQENVMYIVYTRQWTDYGGPENHDASVKETKKQFARCEEVCKNLLNGKLYYCFRSAHCDDLEISRAGRDEYVDLLNNTVKQNRREIHRLMWRHKPLSACQHCLRGTDRNVCIPRGK